MVCFGVVFASGFNGIALGVALMVYFDAFSGEKQHIKSGLLVFVGKKPIFVQFRPS